MPLNLRQIQKFNSLEMQVKWKTKHKVILEEQQHVLRTNCTQLNEKIVSNPKGVAIYHRTAQLYNGEDS